MSERRNETRTLRGFSMPESHAEQRRHEREEMLVVKLTQFEHDLLRPGFGVAGKFCLIQNEDGSHDLVRYADRDEQPPFVAPAEPVTVKACGRCLAPLERDQTTCNCGARFDG